MASFTRLPKIPRASGSDAGLIKPDTWNTLVTNVEALERRFLSIQPKPSADIGIKSAPDGFTPFIKKHNKGGGARLGGAFFTQYTDSLGDTYLQGGGVTGSSGGSATVADYKLIDADTGITSTAGNILYLTANVTAVIEDDLMLPGCTLNSAVLSDAAAIPDNDVITVTSATGNIYVEIGRWTDSGFRTASAPGNFLASGTVGYFVLSKL